MGNIRMVKNVVLNIEVDGETSTVLFAFGNIYNTTKIEKSPNGYCNIYMKDGSVVRGVSEAVFHQNNNEFVLIDDINQEPSIEIESDEVEEKVVPFQGIVISEQPIINRPTT